MFSIFSVQNLQTFLRRKNLRPPPPSRGGPPGPRPPPPKRGRSPPGRSPPGRGPELRGVSGAAACSGAFVSSAITLLKILESLSFRAQRGILVLAGAGRNLDPS